MSKVTYRKVREQSPYDYASLFELGYEDARDGTIDRSRMETDDAYKDGVKQYQDNTVKLS